MFCRKCGKTIDDESTFCRFCGTEVVQASKETRIEREYRQNNELYEKAKALMDSNCFEEARTILLDLSGFRNADELAERCITGAIDYRRRTTYEYAAGVLKNDEATKSDLLQAAEDLEALGEYKDAEELAEQCRSKAMIVLERAYKKACDLLSSARTSSEMLSACEELEKLGSYKDSAELSQKERSQLERYEHYEYAVKCFNEASTVRQLTDVIDAFRAMGDFLDSEEMCNKAFEKIYSEADKSASKDTTDTLYYAARTFESIKSYKDAEQRALECRKRAEEIIAERKEKARREEEEADERELQYCKRILNNPKAPISEIERVEGRLYLIKNHEGAEAAIEECKQRHESLQKKAKRNTVIGIIVVSAIAVVIVLSLIFVNAILPAINYSNAMSFAEQGKYSEAAEEFAKLNGYKDSDKMAAKMRAQTYIEQGKIDEAASLLYNASLYGLANQCLESEFDRLVSEEKFDEAIEFADRHYELEENQTALCMDMIDKLLDSNNYDAAIERCEKYLSDEAAESGFYKIADACADNKQWVKAAETYQKAGDYLDAKEMANECYAKHADECRNFKYYDLAITFYNKAGMTDSVNECYLEMGQRAYNQGNYREAIQYFGYAGDIGKEKKEKCQEDIYQKGVTWANDGLYDGAIELFESVRPYKDSNDYIVCCNAMNSLFEGATLQKTIKTLENVRKGHSNDDAEDSAYEFAKRLLNGYILGDESDLVSNNEMASSVYAYLAVFSDDYGNRKTICVLDKERQLMVMSCPGNALNYSEDKDNLIWQCYFSGDEYNLYYDVYWGYYVIDNGVDVYLDASGDCLVIGNSGYEFLEGTYSKEKLVFPHGM